MRNTNFIILIALIVSCSTEGSKKPGSSKSAGSSKSVLGDAVHRIPIRKNISSKDSAFIYQHFLTYDPVTNEYGDLDEPTVYDYWNEENSEAVRYYRLGTELIDIPAYQRMIFASYLYGTGMKKHVRDVLTTLYTRSDTVEVFYTMSSYGVSFEEFDIRPEVVKEYCPSIAYE